MSVWEYKVISSGKGGFATPALLEKFLGDLGRDEWEIIHYQSPPDNSLAFSGLARRTTQRDWTLQDAAAAAAKAEAEKLRAEFAAKFEAATRHAPASAGTAEEKPPASFLEEKSAPDDGFRKPVDTSRDDDPEAHDEAEDDWDKLTAAEQDELPNFFDAMKPHLRRNQRGPGMSAGVEFLAKKWDFTEDDVKGALVECGFTIPEDEDAKPVYLEFDGDLYWLNINRRGELWINTKEKPRQLFRTVKGTPIEVAAEEPRRDAPDHRRDPAAPAAAHFVPGTHAAPASAPAPSDGAPAAAAATPGEIENRESKIENSAAPAAPGAPLPTGLDLLRKVEPLMRRNRRGPGGSGSVSFLSRALHCADADLLAGFATLGLVLPAHPQDKSNHVEIAGAIWWINQDSRGGVWINGRDKKPGETLAPAPQVASAAPTEPSANVPGDATSTAPAGTPDAPPAPDHAAPIAANSPTGQGETSASASPAYEVTMAPWAHAAPASVAPAATAYEVTVAPWSHSTAPLTVAAPAPIENRESKIENLGAPASPLAALRLLLKETKTGAVAGKLERLAETLGQTPEHLLAALTGAGLNVPAKPREKPVFVEHAGEIFWLNRNAKDELWLNAKASKFTDKSDDAEPSDNDDDSPATPAPEEKKPRRSRLHR
ncbi:MAG: hypothetical protein RLZZ15_3302 [Verrucomicrobiota bacterium]|jgi:hypothetical protein